MDTTDEAPKKRALVRVVDSDRARIAEPSFEVGSDGARQRIDHIMLPLALEPSELQPRNSKVRPPRDLPKGKELLQVVAATGTGAPGKIGKFSRVLENNQDISDTTDRDIGKGKMSEGRDVEAGSHYSHQDNDDDSICRICHMNSATDEIVDLGCACKLDLGQAHRRCAETWFTFKGNRECEICGEIAENVKPPELKEASHVSTPDTVVILNIHYRTLTRWVCLRLFVICLIWVVIVFLLYKFLVPSFRKAASRANNP